MLVSVNLGAKLIVIIVLNLLNFLASRFEWFLSSLLPAASDLWSLCVYDVGTAPKHFLYINIIVCRFEI